MRAVSKKQHSTNGNYLVSFRSRPTRSGEKHSTVRMRCSSVEQTMPFHDNAPVASISMYSGEKPQHPPDRDKPNRPQGAMIYGAGTAPDPWPGWPCAVVATSWGWANGGANATRTPKTTATATRRTRTPSTTSR